MEFKYVKSPDPKLVEFFRLPNECLNGYWECSDGQIVGRGKSKWRAQSQYLDYRADEEFDDTIGWG